LKHVDPQFEPLLASRPEPSDDESMITVGRATGFLAALFAAVSSVSCGGSDGGSCATPPACGGDIVGSWKITSSCLHLAGTLDLDQTCTGVPVNADVQYSGMASYTAAMTYSETFSVTGSETFVFPGACLSGATCDQINQRAQSSPPDGITSLHCSAAGGGGCSCTATLASQSATDTGTYTLSGTGVTTTSTTTSGDVETDQYCVMGSQLQIVPGANSGAVGATATGSITLMKQ